MSNNFTLGSFSVVFSFSILRNLFLLLTDFGIIHEFQLLSMPVDIQTIFIFPSTISGIDDLTGDANGDKNINLHFSTVTI